MIHEAYMPVYRCPDFHCRRAGGHTDRSTLVSKKKKILRTGCELPYRKVVFKPNPHVAKHILSNIDIFCFQISFPFFKQAKQNSGKFAVALMSSITKCADIVYYVPCLSKSKYNLSAKAICEQGQLCEMRKSFYLLTTGYDVRKLYSQYFYNIKHFSPQPSQTAVAIH